MVGNLYLQLQNFHVRGVKATDISSDIKKAYRKAALKHHPDKVWKCFMPVIYLC